MVRAGPLVLASGHNRNPVWGQNKHQLDEQTRAKLLETARAMVLRGDSKFSVTSLCAQAGVERAVFRAPFQRQDRADGRV